MDFYEIMLQQKLAGKSQSDTIPWDDILPIDTASGDIASFPDGTDLLGAKSVLVELEPIQDLHGYDKPWRGGAGANLLDLDKAAFVSSAYGMSISRSGDVVTISGTSTGSGNLSFALLNNYADDSLGGKGYVCQVFNVTSGYTVGNCWGFRTETEKSFAIRLDNITQGQNVNVSMKLSVAKTSQSAWTPYSNECPISGRTECDTYVSPTTSETDAEVYTTTLGRTVYGCTLDVVSGELTVTHALVDLGTLNWGEYGSTSTVTQYYTTSLDALAKRFGQAISDVFYYSQPMVANTIYISQPSGMTYVRTEKDEYANPTAFKTAMSGHQLCYELATPQTYQLTPTEVALLHGNNNVWSDGSVSVEYYADVQKWVEKKLG